MKQAYILNSYGSIEDNATIGKGCFYYPNDPKTAVEDTLAGDCGFIVIGNNGHVYNHSDIDFETLSVVKTEPVAGTNFEAAITAPTEVEEDCVYTLLLSKKGAGFNVRNNWTHSVLAKSDDADDVMNELAKLVNANGINTGLTAEYAEGTLTIKASDYTDWAVNVADDWTKPEITIVSGGASPIGDGAYVADLLHQCAAGKGVNYLAEDGKELYPSFNQMISQFSTVEPTFTIYTLRFAVPRKSAKTRDEVVSQLVHIIVGNPSVASTLDTVLGIGDNNTAETTEVLGDGE